MNKIIHLFTQANCLYYTKCISTMIMVKGIIEYIRPHVTQKILFFHRIESSVMQKMQSHVYSVSSLRVYHDAIGKCVL